MKKIIKQLAEGFVNGEQPLPYFPGLYRGKAGIAVFLCHYSAYSNEKSYCDYAFELIQTSHRQLMGKNPVNYPYGLSGVGSAVAYLIQNNFFNADADELLAEYDAVLSNHIIDFVDLSSFKQILGCEKYFSYRLQDTRKLNEIKEIHDKTILLINLQRQRDNIDVVSSLQTGFDHPVDVCSMSIPQVKEYIKYARKHDDCGLIKGLTGIGLSCLTSLDNNHSKWLDLIL